MENEIMNNVEVYEIEPEETYEVEEQSGNGIGIAIGLGIAAAGYGLYKLGKKGYNYLKAKKAEKDSKVEENAAKNDCEAVN